MKIGEDRSRLADYISPRLFNSLPVLLVSQGLLRYEPGPSEEDKVAALFCALSFSAVLEFWSDNLWCSFESK